MESESTEITDKSQVKSRKLRSTDHKVVRIYTDSVPQEEGEFQEKKKRPQRIKRKAPGISTDGDAPRETDASAPKKPHFSKLSDKHEMSGPSEMRKVRIPANRFKALKDSWLDIYNPIVKQLFLQVRFNVKAKRVEIKSCKETKEISALQKAEDFVRAFSVGFEVQDALALVRLDDLYLESFMVQDVKTLRGDHLARAIGRIAGKGGRTKYTIENVTKTRIVLQESKINILGTFHNIAAARRAISNLILGSPPSKVYGTMRAVAAKVHDRF
ncbi:RNA-binding protein PNO1-like [Watersipora subatra]|uniref:RNA-binding protein PNO1-like n=1 Tax=Watersipora subatra TaxID=2589382 RepID=UPI00355B7607